MISVSGRLRRALLPLLAAALPSQLTISLLTISLLTISLLTGCSGLRSLDSYPSKVPPSETQASEEPFSGEVPPFSIEDPFYDEGIAAAPDLPQGDYLSEPANHHFKDLYLTARSERAEDQVSASPKKPWGDFAIESEETQSSSNRQPWWAQILLWVPNRVLDLIDVVKLDVGAGMSFGAVARITKFGQFGYRSLSPLSVRVGLFGRKLPVLVEHSSEFGIGPGFLQSSERTVCKGEIGAGADLFIVGAYGGICVDELLDFVAGIFFLDVSGDDLK